jgi:hypothetical protein
MITDCVPEARVIRLGVNGSASGRKQAEDSISRSKGGARVLRMPAQKVFIFVKADRSAEDMPSSR